MQPKHWTVFVILGLIWSSSFLWIKVALEEVGPITIVAYRSVFGLIFAGAAVFIQRKKWPRNLGEWLPFFVLGLIGVAAPFFLIGWAEQRIDSAVASILNALVPLLTLVIAHFSLKDDKMSLQRVLGLLLGFLGVIVLLSKDIQAGQQNSLLGQGAVILATIFYAITGVYARKNTGHVSGLVRGVSPLVSASVIMWLIAPFAEGPIVVPTLPMTWVALLWLGVFSSGVAFVMLYYLLHEIGPTRTSMVTYIFPLGGLILGVIFLDEQLTWQLAVGSLIITLGIVVANWQPKK
jgi:drug/metabolite transporter (DMT)-like permease